MSPYVFWRVLKCPKGPLRSASVKRSPERTLKSSKGSWKVHKIFKITKGYQNAGFENEPNSKFWFCRFLLVKYKSWASSGKRDKSMPSVSFEFWVELKLCYPSPVLEAVLCFSFWVTKKKKPFSIWPFVPPLNCSRATQIIFWRKYKMQPSSSFAQKHHKSAPARSRRKTCQNDTRFFAKLRKNLSNSQPSKWNGSLKKRLR